MTKLTNRKWKLFNINDIFKVYEGKRMTKQQRHSGKIPFINTSVSNNGVTDFINVTNNSKGYHKNAISINYNASAGYSFYHRGICFYSDDTNILINKHLNIYTGLFIVTCINQQCSKFSYGFPLSSERLKAEKINLPITKNNKPDWNFMNKYIKQIIHYVKIKMTKIDLSKLTWKKFRIGDIFHIYGGDEFPKKNRKSGKIPLISASANNNGISDYVKCDKKAKGCHKNFISVSRAGSVGYAFYHHNKSFVLSNARALINNKLNLFTGLFIATAITYERHNFDYGYQMNSKRLSNLRIWLPVNNDNKPNWQFMETYIKSMIKMRVALLFRLPILKLSDEKWRLFNIKDIFKICKGKRITKQQRHSGKIPFISASVFNNGVTDFINTTNDSKGCHKNAISINYNASAGYAFYHKGICFYLDDTNVLVNKHLNVYTGLFIVTCINQQCSKYSYGFQLSSKRLKYEKINLPITKQDKPDWNFMNDYMKRIINDKNEDILDNI